MIGVGGRWSGVVGWSCAGVRVAHEPLWLGWRRVVGWGVGLGLFIPRLKGGASGAVLWLGSFKSEISQCPKWGRQLHQSIA